MTIPDPPSTLPEPVHGFWRETLELLAKRGVKDPDLAAVRMLCTFKHRNDQATDEINRLGLLIRGAQGPMLHPLLRVERESAAAYLRVRDALGLADGLPAPVAPAAPDERPEVTPTPSDELRAKRERRRAGA